MKFRQYLEHMWFEHKDEIEFFEHKMPDYDKKEYFARVKWWLRQEYRKHEKEETSRADSNHIR